MQAFSFGVWNEVRRRGNIPPAMEPHREATGVTDVAERLRVSRLALKLTQARLCGLAGISTAAWNNAETGDARIGVDNAILLCQATGLTLDWVFRGIRSGLPTGISEAISHVEAQPVPPKRAKG